MSEYQYYEFVAIDGPISDEGLRYATKCSSRAKVSRRRWQNTYDFGDFRGSVDTMLKYYDAHFYIANWGTVRLALAFPKGVIAPKTVQPYLWKRDRYEDTLSVTETGNRFIISWELNQDDGWDDWIEGEGLIDQLSGVREELMRSDYRALFLGWLADFHPDGLDPEDDTLVVPPIPAGLDQLSPALEALVQHFLVDPDALAVAAALSQAQLPDRLPIATVLEKLSVLEMRALLARVAEGGGMGVMTELNRLTYPAIQIQAGKGTICKDLAVKVIETREVREKKEAEAAAAKRQREVELRKEHLASVMQRADAVWSELDPLMEQGIASAYDRATVQLKELRDAYEQTGDISGFRQRLEGFRIRYSNRSAMLRRIETL